MGDPVKINLQENDRVVMQRQPGGSYALRLFRNGNDQGLLTSPPERPGAPTRPLLVTRDTPLLIEGSGKNAELNIPADIDFAARIIVNTTEKLRIDGGAFVLAKDSKQSVSVSAVDTFARNARLGIGNRDDDRRFPDTARVMRYSETGARSRFVAVEEGAPAIEITNPNGRVLMSFSGGDTMQQTAQNLGVAQLGGPVAQPQASAPAATPAGVAPPAPTGPQATGPLNNNAAFVANSIGTQVKNMGGMVSSAPQGVRDSYERINRAAEKLRGTSPTHEDVRALRAAMATEMETLKTLGEKDATARSSTTMLGSILDGTIRNLDRIPGKQANPAPANPQPAPSGQPAPAGAAPNNPLAATIASRAESYAKQGGNGIPELMRPLAQAARTAQTNATPENRQKLSEALNKTIEGLKRLQADPRALMQMQDLQNYQQQLSAAAPGNQTGLSSPTPANMPESVRLAIAQAIDPSIARQQAGRADHNNIQGTTNLPGANGGQIIRQT